MVTKRAQTSKDISSFAVRRGVSAKRYLPETPVATKETTTARKSRAIDFNSPAIRQQIETKAYELYEKRGYSHGNDLQDWLDAEQIIRRELSGI